MSAISVTVDNAKILLALVQDMVANRMAVHQVTPEIQAAVQEMANAIVVADTPVAAPAVVEETPVEAPAEAPSE